MKYFIVFADNHKEYLFMYPTIYPINRANPHSMVTFIMLGKFSNYQEQMILVSNPFAITDIYQT